MKTARALKLDPEVVLEVQRLEIKELRRSLEGLSPDSELYQNLNDNLRQLNHTMSNLEDLTSTLSDQPNAAVFGSKLPPDPEPEARRP